MHKLMNCALLAVVFLLQTVLRVNAQSSDDSLKIYVQLGETAYNEGQFSDAEHQFLLAAKLARTTKSPKYLEIMNSLGNVVGYMGQSEQALGYFQEALRHISEAKEPRVFEAKILKNIGATYSDLKDFKTAMTYLSKAESISRELNNEGLLADCLNNKGIIYEQTDSMPQALEMYEAALLSYRRLNDPDRLALVHINIGVVAKGLKKLDVALAAYDSALKYSRAIGNDFYIAATLNNRGNVLMEMKRFDEAIASTKESLALARKIGQSDVEQNGLESLADQYHAKGDDGNAFLYQKAYVVLHDSLISIERVDALTEMETKYQVEKKELELDKLSAENALKEEENQRSKLYMLMLGAGLVLVLIGVLVFVRFNALKQKKRELELVAATERQERERIAKDMHDELGSGISRITWITATAQRNSSDSEKGNYNQIENIASQLSQGMKSLIWLLNTGDCSWEVLAGRIREMASQMSEDFGFDFKYSESQIDHRMVVRQAVARDLFLLFKEAINNASKYSKAKRLQLIVDSVADEVRVSIEDDGVGFDAATVQRGHGLTNMQRRADAMNGDLKIQSNLGTGTIIEIVLSKSSLLSN